MQSAPVKPGALFGGDRGTDTDSATGETSSKRLTGICVDTQIQGLVPTRPGEMTNVEYSVPRAEARP